MRKGLLALTAALLVSTAAHAELDLKQASVARLGNGLTVLVLEEHALPVVSVQMLYKTGAKDEVTGKTGLAHFMEHMAFRASKNFPHTRIASSIYAVGGEWHAYTWLDETTYFETAPKQDLPLLLRVESDRMHNMLIPAKEVDAERGAVLTEMHSYENDPASVLHDDVMYSVFWAHPYRNNTIGFESDVDGITRADIETFYRKHYAPANAVLAIVGDVNTQAVLKAVKARFGAIPAGQRTPPIATIEPPQQGIRRLSIAGPGKDKHFEVAFHAPSSRSRDYAAFLLLQDILGGGSGVSFLQNDWGTPARQGSFLYGIGDSIATWYPPSAQPYVFTISGTAPETADQAAIESAIAKAVARLKAADLSALLPQARARVKRQLAFDVETTEDAAHQLAFFEGIDALDVLQSLPSLLDKVTPADIERVVATYLRPDQRTIGWYVPGTPPPAIPRGPVEPHPATPHLVRPQHVDERASAPVVAALANGTPAIVERSPLSDTAELKVVLPGNRWMLDGDAASNDPAWGYTTLSYQILPQGLDAAIAKARAALKAAKPAGPSQPSSDPETRLGESFDAALGFAPVAGAAAPALVAVSGDVDPKQVLAALDKGFAGLPKADAHASQAPATLKPAFHAELPHATAQYALGYVVAAPAPTDRQSYAYQLALYCLTHGYGGRLGDEAITRRGLVYYIDSAYRSDGKNGWITLDIGVDPDKLEAMKALMQRYIAGLAANPPSKAEIAEARQYLLGRMQSAAQSNAEITSRLTQQYLWRGHLTDRAQLAAILNTITPADVVAAAKGLAGGTVITVSHR